MVGRRRGLTELQGDGSGRTRQGAGPAGGGQEDEGDTPPGEEYEQDE